MPYVSCAQLEHLCYRDFAFSSAKVYQSVMANYNGIWFAQERFWVKYHIFEHREYARPVV